MEQTKKIDNPFAQRWQFPGTFAYFSNPGFYFAFVHFALSSNPQNGPHVVCKAVSHERVAFNTETPGLKFFTVKHSLAQ